MIEIINSKKIELHPIGEDQEYKPIRQTKASWEFYADSDALTIIEDIFLQSEGTYQMVMYEDGIPIYIGNVTPDQYEEPDEHLPVPIELIASDLAILKNTETPVDDRYTVIKYIAALLNLAGISGNIHVIQDYAAEGGAESTTRPLEDCDFSSLTFQDSDNENTIEDAYTALEMALKPFGLEIVQHENEWYIFHFSTQLNSTVDIDNYDSSGEYIDTDSDVNIEDAVTLLGGNTKFLNRGYKKFISLFKHGKLSGNSLISYLDFTNDANWEAFGDVDDAILGYDPESQGRVCLITDAAGNMSRITTSNTFNLSGATDVAGGLVNVSDFINYPDLTGLSMVLDLKFRWYQGGDGLDEFKGAFVQFKFKIGDYYLELSKVNGVYIGSWTLTPNIIQFGTYRASPLTLDTFGGSRHIEIASIPENGDIDIQFGGVAFYDSDPQDNDYQTVWYPPNIQIEVDQEGNNNEARGFELVNNASPTFDTFDFGETRIGSAITSAHAGGLILNGEYDLSWTNALVTAGTSLEFCTLLNFFFWLKSAKKKYDLNYRGRTIPYYVLTRDSVRYKILDQQTDLIHCQSKSIILELNAEQSTEYTTQTNDIAADKNIINQVANAEDIVSKMIEATEATDPISLSKTSDLLSLGLNIGANLEVQTGNLAAIPSGNDTEIQFNDNGAFGGLNIGANLEVQTGDLAAIPSGNDTEIQFNDNGGFGGDSDFTWDNILKILSIISGTFSLEFGVAGKELNLIQAIGDNSQINFRIDHLDSGLWVTLGTGQTLSYFQYSDAFTIRKGTGGYGQIYFKSDGSVFIGNSITSGAGAGAIFSIISGKVGINTNSPTELLDINSDAVRIRNTQTPASSTATGDKGMIAWDENFLYICIATDTWVRVPLQQNFGGNPHGEMYGYEISETVSVGASNTWYELTAGLSGGLENLCTFQNSHEIKVGEAGRYKVSWHLSVTSNVGNEIMGAVGVNNTEVTKVACHGTVAGGSSYVGIAGSGILDLEVNDVVSLFVNNQSAANDIDVQHAGVTLTKIAGTE